MKLVVDANELFAGIIAKGKNLQSWTLGIMFSDEVELFAPFRLLAELENNREEIRSKSGFSLHDFEAFVGILELRVRFIPLEQFLDKISEAKVLAPHLKDVEYFALALKLDCPIWAQEKAFKKQSGVKVFATSDLFPLLFEL
jgi:predicted nucleic acid-binding protein